MRDRLTNMLGPVARAIWILTFHAACGRILRREAERLGYRSNFTIYDSADQVRLVKQCLEELEKDPKRFVPRGVHAQISNAKNQLVTRRCTRSGSRPSTTRRSPRRTSSTSASSPPRTRSTSTTCSCSRCRSWRRSRTRRRRQNAFRYVLVDEYQDTNHAQYRLPQLLAEAHTNAAPWAIRTSPFTRSEEPTSATSSSSSATSPRRGRSRSSRTTAPRTRSSRRRTR